MAKPMQMEEAADKMRQLLAEDLESRLSGANEAETRLLIIDEVLAILGWSKSEYKPERPTSTHGYTDYMLHIDRERRLIVEAKRIGHMPALPSKIQKQQYTNSFLYNNCGPEMQSLLQQCKYYCLDTGVPYAIATTGSVWIILTGFRRGIEWGELRSFVFHSLRDVYNRFAEFYSLVGRENVKKNSLEERFQGMTIVKPQSALRPRKLVGQCPDVGEVPNRSVISAYFDQFMSEITRPHQEDMLKHCYVENRNLTEFSRDLQQLLSYDATLDEQDDPIDQIDEQELDKEMDLQLGRGNPRTILVVGNIGAGKSTFISRFLLESRPKKSVCAVIDLINEATVSVRDDRTEQQNLAGKVLESLSRVFENKEVDENQTSLDPFDNDVLQRSFEQEISRFRKQRPLLYDQNRGKYQLEEEERLVQLSQDKFLHLMRYVRYARSRGYKTWVAFDNVDRGSDSYQRFVYSFAHQLSTEAGCVTLITLREDTFLEAKEAGFLDVRTTDRVFKITAPEFKQVISKRRKYVERLISTGNLHKPLKSYADVIKALNHHLTQIILGESDSIRMLVTSFSLKNIRFGLSLIRDYYLSYHSTFHEFFRRSEADTNIESAWTFDPNYEFDRFLQALMLRNSWSYEEGSSEVFNLFAVNPQEQTSHLLMLRILAYLTLERSMLSTRLSMKYETLLSDFVFLGFQKHHISDAVHRLLLNGLLVSPNLPAASGIEVNVAISDMLSPEIKIALSAKGAFYLNIMAANDYYKTRVGEDTVWYDEEHAVKYVDCLRECAASQPNGDAFDLLSETSAEAVFTHYLRNSLVLESQDWNRRFATKSWALHMEELVERKVFGERIIKPSMVIETEAVPEGEAASTSRDRSKLSRLARNGKGRTPNGVFAQLGLFGDDKPGINSLLSQARKSLGTLPSDLKVGKSHYAVRVLWSLELASRAGLESVSASDIAKIIREYGGLHVEETNVARFFRAERLSDEHSHLWTEPRPHFFAISQVGRVILQGLLDKRRRR